MRNSEKEIRKEIGSFREFVTARENRKTILLIIFAVLALVGIKTAKDMFSGAKYIAQEAFLSILSMDEEEK